MSSTSLETIPFSPVLFAGFLARPLPLAPLNILLSKAIRHIHSRHARVFSRMQAIETPIFHIVPTDLPFTFVLDANATRPTLVAVKDKSPSRPSTATISGSFSSLTALLQGDIDGDALFFSRTLTISGDTEAVLALRNAVDSSEIDLMQELKLASGPLAELCDHASKLFARFWRRAESDFSVVAQSLTAKQTKQIRHQQTMIDTLEKKVSVLTKRQARKHSNKKMVSA